MGETHKTAGDCCRKFAEARAVTRDAAGAREKVVVEPVN
jgi:hypothetical protein